MEGIFDWIRPILSGLVGAAIIWAMVAFTKNKGQLRGSIRILTYGLPFKIFSALLIPFAAFVVYAVSQSYKGQEIPAFLVAAGFISGAIFFPYQVFLVKFGYDEKYIYYKSPICGDKKVPWTNLLEVGYSKLLQSDYIMVEGVGKIWCSNLLNGYSELGEFLEKKVQELYPDES